MCVILHKLEGNIVDKDDLEQAYLTNSDGSGIMFRNGKNVVTKKGMYTFEELYKMLSELGSREYVLHMRIATHGKINTNNCHPFHVGNGIYMMHNGILSQIPIIHKDMSDTWHFSKLLKRGNVKFNDSTYEKLEKFHGCGNRLAFMTPNITKTTGEWRDHEGNKWSNLYWQYSSRFYSSAYSYDAYDDDSVTNHHYYYNREANNQYYNSQNKKKERFSSTSKEQKPGLITYYP